MDFMQDILNRSAHEVWYFLPTQGFFLRRLVADGGRRQQQEAESPWGVRQANHALRSLTFAAL